MIPIVFATVIEQSIKVFAPLVVVYQFFFKCSNFNDVFVFVLTLDHIGVEISKLHSLTLLCQCNEAFVIICLCVPSQRLLEILNYSTVSHFLIWDHTGREFPIKSYSQSKAYFLIKVSLDVLMRVSTNLTSSDLDI